jgi:GT2 family glycosyltransferase
MISVIIPTFKSPEALNLCLKSAILGQKNKNQIIVVVDGHYDINETILNEWKDSIDVLNLVTNVGLCRATNLGVYNAIHDRVLIVNDDNVFPKGWDDSLTTAMNIEGCVITPNQIEPNPSMFKQFVIKDLGKSPDEFDLNKFWEFDNVISVKGESDQSGCTLPIFMSKLDFIRIGGWDENYEMGMVADWDFFLKCKLSNLTMWRDYGCHFYHFAKLSTNGDNRNSAERNGHEYAKYKWGSYIKHDPTTNDKFL